MGLVQLVLRLNRKPQAGCKCQSHALAARFRVLTPLDRPRSLTNTVDSARSPHRSPCQALSPPLGRCLWPPVRYIPPRLSRPWGPLVSYPLLSPPAVVPCHHDLRAATCTLPSSCRHSHAAAARPPRPPPCTLASARSSPTSITSPSHHGHSLGPPVPTCHIHQLTGHCSPNHHCHSTS